MEERRLLYLRPQQVQPDPQSIRQNQGDIAALAASIARQGLLQPIGVIHMWGNTYRAVYGHRRLQAAQQLGMDRIPCLVLEIDPDELFVPQLVENLQRLDLNDIEKGEAMARMRDHFEAAEPHLTRGELDEKVGEAIGLSGRSVRRYISLLELPADIQQMIRQGELTVTQAQHLLRIPNAQTQAEVAREAAEGTLTAAEVSQLAAFFAANPTLTIETALQALEQGAQLRREVPPEPVEGPMGRLTRVPIDEPEERIWEAEEELGEEPIPPAGPQPGDWDRLRRFQSLDQVLDEAGRMSRTLYEGDMERWVRQDEQAEMKLRLLLRQLRATIERLEQIGRVQGWSLE